MNINSNNLIAPCGMNCGICYTYLRKKNKCPGCRFFNSEKPVSIARCKIRNCEKIKDKKINFCFECDKFPCKRLKDLDKRYRTKYNMSEIENLEMIRDKGLDFFLKDQGTRWKCKKCGGIICVHKKMCLDCDSNNL